ncbi:S49 family peptidase [Enterobacter mori]|uniref:S49 family peptidase n=1 Tax=Enterobacter mori TaxID=539813 RepID=UPI003B8422E0
MSWRNLQYVAARTLNQPLLMEPAYARVFFCALSERLGVSRIVDAVTGQEIGGDSAKELAIDFSSSGGRQPKAYRVEQGIAVLPVSGTLVHKFGFLQPKSGITGYDGIVARLQAAIADPDVKGVLLDIDSPGGEVAGAFDTADIIARLRAVKPIWSVASDMACSAGYLLASACTRRLITQTGVVGSIGVVVAHRSVEKALEQAGIDITLIYSGAHKVDGNPYQSLPDSVRDEIQAKIDGNRALFAQRVAGYTGLRQDAVMATEGAVYQGDSAIRIGLANQVVNYADAVSVMAEAIKSKGVSMSTNDPLNANPLAVNAADAQHGEGELARVMAILDCEEAQGRELLARELARTPGITAERAREILKTSPQSAQIRTETALDRLMSTAPDAIGADNGGDDSDVSGLLSAVSRL